MIVQCETCQTRFRLADEKIKPGGTKVRCSKCKEVFTVTLPEPEPEVVEEAVDFDSFNMEKVTEDVPAETSPMAGNLHAGAPGPEAQQTSPPEPDMDSAPEEHEQAGSDALDFSALESEMKGAAGRSDELADDFSFADTGRAEQTSFDEGHPASAEGQDFSIGEGPQEEPFSEEPIAFGAVSEEAEEPSGPIEFDFSETAESVSQAADWSDSAPPAQGPAEPGEFSFDSAEEESPERDESDEFFFGGEDDKSTALFDETEEAAAPEHSVSGEFSFEDDEDSFADDSASAWNDESSGDENAFDFEEPTFDTDNAPSRSSAASPDAGDLQFGEIDFSSDSDEGVDDFSTATMPLMEEPEPFKQAQHTPTSPSRGYDDQPLPAPPAKKSSLSRILVLLVLLLTLLGGAAGYLFMQEGSFNLNTIVQYLPFLQEYIGETPASLPGERIGITIAGSSYVNGQAGQMLVIQGAAVNNHLKTRSAITVKGVLLDAKGQPLLQQTVFCGNKLDDTALKSMSFAAIEEAMNNQFGDGLSNMNVAAGTAIPFTIVFHNLPTGIANINVEVVDSKPGAN